MFKLVAQAYETLSNEDLKRKYDYSLNPAQEQDYGYYDNEDRQRNDFFYTHYSERRAFDIFDMLFAEMERDMPFERPSNRHYSKHHQEDFDDGMADMLMFSMLAMGSMFGGLGPSQGSFHQHSRSNINRSINQSPFGNMNDLFDDAFDQPSNRGGSVSRVVHITFGPDGSVVREETVSSNGKITKRVTSNTGNNNNNHKQSIDMELKNNTSNNNNKMDMKNKQQIEIEINKRNKELDTKRQNQPHHDIHAYTPKQNGINDGDWGNNTVMKNKSSKISGQNDKEFLVNDNKNNSKIPNKKTAERNSNNGKSTKKSSTGTTTSHSSTTSSTHKSHSMPNYSNNINNVANIKTSKIGRDVYSSEQFSNSSNSKSNKLEDNQAISCEKTVSKQSGGGITGFLSNIFHSKPNKVVPL
jgi:curved DNA-binding protein CbpA